jgi:hypothetical protein
MALIHTSLPTVLLVLGLLLWLFIAPGLGLILIVLAIIGYVAVFLVGATHTHLH